MVEPTTSSVETLIDRAALRLGGVDRLRGIERLRYIAEGIVTNGLQGRDPADVDSPTTQRAFTRRVDLEFAGHRHRRVSELAFDGADVTFTETYVAGEVRTTSISTGASFARASGEAAFTDSLSRYVPALIIRRALDNEETAALSDAACLSGALVDGVDFSWNENVRLRIYLDRDDQRLVRLRATSGDPLRGQDIVTYDFTGERIVDGLSFPQHVIYSRRGTPFTSAALSFDANPTFNDADFLPGLFTETPAAGAAYDIGGGAYEMPLGGEDNYAHFFDLGDSVAVFDAQQGSAAEVIAAIQRVLGPKPIRYVVISHFHDDHAGDVGAYAALGATIVTTRDNASVLSRLAHPVPQGEVPADATPLDFLFVDAAPVRLRGLGGRALVVYRLNDLPHVRSMLVAYHERSRTIAESDLFAEFSPIDDNSVIFADWLRRRSAPRVNGIVGSHHRRGDVEDFQAQVAAYRDAR